MIQLLRLLKGYVEFCAEGGFPERFINLCKINGISMWNVKNDGVKVFACTTEKEFEALSLPAQNSGMTLKIIKNYGLKSFSIRHKWRCGAVFGIFTAFLFWVLMSGYIWEVEIPQTKYVNAEAFTESLAELGVKVGARKSGIDIIYVQNQLMNEYRELLWVSVNIFGGKAQVEISEVVAQKDLQDKNKPVNIIASKKGEIVLVKGYRGVNAVKAGDNVTEGALLISGVGVNADLTEFFVRAEGEVFARTENEENFSCNYKNNLLMTRDNGSRYYVYVFSLKIPLGLKTKGEYSTESKKLLESGEAILPFGIIREDNFTSKGVNSVYSLQEARLCSLLKAVKAKRRDYNDSELKNVVYTSEEKENSCCVKLKIDCIENIAKESPFYTEK